MGSQALLQSQLDSIIGPDVSWEESVAIGRSMTGEGETPPEPLYHLVDLTPPNISIEQVTKDQKEEAITTGKLIENSNSISIPVMVFHFMRADDINKQNIISIRNIFDPYTIFPSWVKLLEILKDDDERGVFFQEGHHFLIVNDRIQVTNERQFLACFQYLLDSNVLNSEALVYKT